MVVRKHLLIDDYLEIVISFMISKLSSDLLDESRIVWV